jgi:hypothetical protein
MSVNTTFLSTPHSNQDADFRAWSNNLSAQFLAAGWVRSGDTGNINFTTVTKPTNALQYQGSEIFRMADTLQSSAPVFLKIDYGASLNSGNNPGVWLTLGSGTDGSGNLTGSCSFRTPLYSQNCANQVISYVCGDTNRLCMALYTSGSNGNAANTYANANSTTMCFFSIERTKDTNGNDTADGILVHTRDPQTGGSVTFRQYYWNCKSGPGAWEDWGVLLPTPNTAQMTSLTSSVYPLFVVKHPSRFTSTGKITGICLCLFRGAAAQ